MNNQPEQIILIPPTHEQSNPTYHVVGSLAQSFLAFLRSKNIHPHLPPELLEKRGPDNERIMEIEIKAETPLPMLERFIPEFMEHPQMAG